MLQIMKIVVGMQCYRQSISISRKQFVGQQDVSVNLIIFSRAIC